MGDHFRCVSAQMAGMRDGRDIEWSTHATCGELAEEQRSLRREVEDHFRRVAAQLEEMELFTRHVSVSAMGSVDTSSASTGAAAAKAAASDARRSAATCTALQKEVAQASRLHKETELATEQAARRVAQEE